MGSMEDNNRARREEYGRQQAREQQLAKQNDGNFRSTIDYVDQSFKRTMNHVANIGNPEPPRRRKKFLGIF